MKESGKKNKPAGSKDQKKSFFNRSGLLSDPFIQPKLNVNQPGDKFEKEADEIADQVVSNTSEPSSFFSPAPQISAKFFEPGEIHRKGLLKDPEDEIQRSEGLSDTPSVPSSFESSLSESKGTGQPLSDNVKASMGNRMGTDFSNVGIHNNAQSASLSNQINAKAFTHGNDIYFNQGQYQPETREGQHLIAHELTHTVQQGTAVNRKPLKVTQGNERIQRSWLGSAWNAVSGAVSSAVDFIGDSLDAGINWLKERFRNWVTEIPGYRLFTVVLGRDPINNTSVSRNGRNFIEAGLDVIPFGAMFKKKLEEEGALDRAAVWLDQQIAILDINPSQILDEVRRFFSGLSLSDITSPRDVFRRFLNIFSGPIERIITFAGNVARKFLEIVKEFVLNKLIDFVKEQTTAYPLLTVILGRDPITNQVVERTPMNILRGFIQLAPDGEEQLRQMEETGTLQKAADWVGSAIIRVSNAAAGLRNAFSNAWDLLTIENLMQPVETFRQIYNLFAQPVGEIFSFLIEVAVMILKFIKDALLKRLAAFAKTVPGYPLITVILGKDPFTNEPVERSAENIIRGFLLLLPGGEEKFNRLQESGAIQRLTTWLDSAITNLGITWDYIVGLFMGFWQSLTLSQLADPIGMFRNIVGRFGEPIARLFRFIVELIKKVVEILLIIMNFPFDLVSSIITNAMQAIEDIKRDPIEFFLNLLRAVKQGFQQFFDKITTHLLNGLRDWLFGQLGEAGIQPPADLSFQSILGLVMDILGITVDNILNRLALKIGQERVARIRGAIDRLTGIWTFIKDVVERGPVAIWEKIQEQLSNLWNMVVGFIQNWIMTQIIQKVTTKLLSMLDPTGIMAVVNSFIAFFRAVQSFIEQLRAMLQIVNTFVAGVANIARGSIGQAADFLENALAQAIPVAIGFLANQVGLRGLGQRIAEMIEAARERINTAIDWLLDRAIAAGSALLEMGRSAVAAVRNWWENRTQFVAGDGMEHSIFLEGSESSASLMIASEKQPFQTFVNNVDVGSDAEKQTAKTQALALATQIDTIKSDRNIDADQKNAQIASLLEQLKPRAEKLFGTIPVTGIIDTPGTNSAGFAVSMQVKPLTKIGPAGSRPTPAVHAVYDKLNKRRQSGGASYYIRGHLLNEQLHGPGQWTNMTPLSRSGNSQHESQVESQVKTAVDTGAIVEYSVTPQYSGQPNKSALLTAIQNSNDDINQKIAKREIVEAEDHVPSALLCTAVTLDQNLNSAPQLGLNLSGVSVTNAVERNFGDYYLSGVPKPDRVGLNSAGEDQLITLPEIDNARANSLIGARKILIDRGRKFRTYEAIVQETIIPLNVLDDLRNQNLVVLD
jgi:hypothetical protein